MRLIAINRD